MRRPALRLVRAGKGGRVPPGTSQEATFRACLERELADIAFRLHGAALTLDVLADGGTEILTAAAAIAKLRARLQ